MEVAAASRELDSGGNTEFPNGNGENVPEDNGTGGKEGNSNTELADARRASADGAPSPDGCLSTEGADKRAGGRGHKE